MFDHVSSPICIISMFSLWRAERIKTDLTLEQLDILFLVHLMLCNLPAVKGFNCIIKNVPFVQNNGVSTQ